MSSENTKLRNSLRMIALGTKDQEIEFFALDALNESKDQALKEVKKTCFGDDGVGNLREKIKENNAIAKKRIRDEGGYGDFWEEAARVVKGKMPESVKTNLQFEAWLNENTDKTKMEIGTLTATAVVTGLIVYEVDGEVVYDRKRHKLCNDRDESYLLSEMGFTLIRNLLKRGSTEDIRAAFELSQALHNFPISGDDYSNEISKKNLDKFATDYKKLLNDLGFSSVINFMLFCHKKIVEHQVVYAPARGA